MGVRDEYTRLRHLKWVDLYEKEKPFQIFVTLPDGVEDPRTDNLVFEDNVEQTIHDVRGNEDKFNIDNHGFQYVNHETKISAFDSKDSIEQVYLPELEQLLKNSLVDADRVVFFNWRIRRNEPAKEEGEMINLNDPMAPLLPITQVHIDTSPYSVLQRIELEFPDEMDALLRGRIRIINVWRPINQPIEDWPLAVCDGSTLKDEDLIRCDHIRPQQQAETTFILQRDWHKWYYMSQQAKSEVLLIKNFDSDPNVKATCCPHTSFEHRQIRDGAPYRESIEVRALVFSDTKSSHTDVEETLESEQAPEVRSDPSMFLC